MEDLIKKVKRFYVSIKGIQRDRGIINSYENIQNKMKKLERKGKALEYCSDSGCLMIFTKQYSRLMDEDDRLQPLALHAMRRESERMMNSLKKSINPFYNNL